jgi:DNA polymerase-3 subunit epsilon
MAINREICFDTETTGLDPDEGHRLIEIGCVELVDGVRTKNCYHQLINPERNVPADAVKIHNITTDMLLDKPKFRDIVDSFVDFIGDCPLVAHNANFDMKFINFELDLISHKKLENKVIDSLMLAKALFPGQKNNLDALCRRYNIDNTKRELNGHGALLDAELLAEVYIELTGGSQKKLIEDDKNIIKSDTVDIDIFRKEIAEKSALENRHFKIDELEMKSHNEFIEKFIKNSLWNE